MNKQQLSLFSPLTLVFIFVTLVFIGTRTWQLENGFDHLVLIAGNLFLFLVTLASLYFHVKGFLNKNPQAFLRNVYGAMMLKMFLSVIVVLVYAVSAGDNLNKPGIFACMGLYFVYTFVELRMVFRLLKQQKKQ